MSKVNHSLKTNLYMFSVKSYLLHLDIVIPLPECRLSSTWHLELERSSNVKLVKQEGISYYKVIETV